MKKNYVAPSVMSGNFDVKSYVICGSGTNPSQNKVMRGGFRGDEETDPSDEIWGSKE